MMINEEFWVFSQHVVGKTQSSISNVRVLDICLVQPSKMSFENNQTRHVYLLSERYELFLSSLFLIEAKIIFLN